jgi:hypothetical protein
VCHEASKVPSEHSRQELCVQAHNLLHEASIEAATAIPAASHYKDLHGNIAAKCRIALW